MDQGINLSFGNFFKSFWEIFAILKKLSAFFSSGKIIRLQKFTNLNSLKLEGGICVVNVSKKNCQIKNFEPRVPTLKHHKKNLIENKLYVILNQPKETRRKSGKFSKTLHAQRVYIWISDLGQPLRQNLCYRTIL